jgi:hypothetical protein
MFVLVSTECPAFDNTASFENCVVICFLVARNMSGAKIHNELCAVKRKYKDLRICKTMVKNVQR